MINRVFKYDGGTVERPYDFNTEAEAQAYYQRMREKANVKLFSDVESLEASLLAEKDKGASSYNEVLAGLRWNCDGTSQIAVFSDNLPSRLLAQEYARIARKRLVAQYRENGEVLPEGYRVPICFYLPDERRFFEPYTQEQQEEDRAKVISILSNGQVAEKLSIQTLEMSYLTWSDANSQEAQKVIDRLIHGQESSLLLALDKSSQLIKIYPALLEKLMCQKMYHLVESLLEKDAGLRHRTIKFSKKIKKVIFLNHASGGITIF